MYYIKLLNKDKYKIFKAARVSTTFFFNRAKRRIMPDFSVETISAGRKRNYILIFSRFIEI